MPVEYITAEDCPQRKSRLAGDRRMDPVLRLSHDLDNPPNLVYAVIMKSIS